VALAQEAAVSKALAAQDPGDHLGAKVITTPPPRGVSARPLAVRTYTALRTSSDPTLVITSRRTSEQPDHGLRASVFAIKKETHFGSNSKIIAFRVPNCRTG